MARGKLAELFYDIRASTEGLGTDLKDAENQLGKIEKYVLAHPAAAFGALSGAVLGVGIAATKMAEEVEGNLRKIEARVPQVAGRMGELRDMIRDMSLAGPHSQAELSGAAAEIARQGANTLEEIQARLGASVKLADATGEDITGIVAGLDQAMDMFRLSASDTEGFLAKLYATAQNRMPITDMFAAFQASAKAIGDFGIDADTATRALGALLEEGLNAKQAGTEFKALAALGADGAARIKELAASVRLTGDAVGKLNDAQAKMNEGAEKSWATIKNNLNAALIDLGQNILPLIDRSMHGLVMTFDLLNGRADDMVQKQKALSGLGTLLQGGLELKRGGITTNMVDQRVAASRVSNGLQDGTLSLAGYSTEQLFAIRTMLEKVYKDIPRIMLANTKDGIGKVFAEMDKAIFATMQKAGAAVPGGRTSEQIKAKQEAAKKEAEEYQKALQGMADEIRKKDADDAADFEKRTVDASKKFWELYRERMADVTDSLVETTQKSFAAMRAAASAGSVMLPKEFDALEARAIAAAKAIRDAELALDHLDQAKAGRQKGTAINLQELAASAERLKTLHSEATAGSKEWKDLGDEIKKVQEQIAKLTLGKTTDELIAQARALQQAVDGALQLAEAFGVIDENAANALRSIAQVALNIPALSKAWETRNGTAKGEGMGALIGAALPVAGAVASLVSGFMNAAKAAREHAEALRAARVKLTESLSDRVAAMGRNDTQRQFDDIDKQRKDDIAAMLDLLIQQKGVSVGTRSDFLAKDPAGQRAVLTDALATASQAGVREALRAAIEQFDLLAVSAQKAKVQLEEELAAKRKDIDESLAERRLNLAGKTEEAGALAFKTRAEAEYKAALDGGVYTTEQLTELRSLLNDEEEKYLVDAKKRREDEDAKKAQDTARRAEDLHTRINSADGETPAERALRVSIEHRRELEDAMAAGANAAELALITLAQAADDAAAAAQAAADAQRAATEAQREMEDFDVELLRLQGKSAEADSQAFENDLKRQYDDAVAAGKSPEYLAKLAEVQAAKRASRATGAVREGASAGAAGAGGDAGGGATSASGTGIGTATIVQVDRMLGLLGTLVAYGHEELDLMKDFVAAALVVRPPLLPPALPSSFTVGAGGQLVQVHVQLTMHFNGPVGGGREGAEALGQLTLAAVDTGLANSALLARMGRGDVGR